MRTAFICLLFLFWGCKKEESCEDCVPDHLGTNATVSYTGPRASDGCEWVIIIGNNHYHPDNLDPAFLVNPLEVEVDYIPTGDLFYCGFVNSGIPVIHITQIKKR